MISTSRDNHLILQVRNLKKYFAIRRGLFQRIVGWNKAVDGVSFEIEQGKTLGLVGESGCGKTTVARLILKLLAPDQGNIFFRGIDIAKLSEKEMRPLRKEIQIVFQDPFGSLNPRMTVGQSIGEGLRIQGIVHAEDRAQRLAELFKMVGMSPKNADRYPHEFSGGQRQRVGIARALSVKPDLIICDEPVSALDVSIQAQIINLLGDLQEELGLSYLFISHDLNVVGYLCSTIAVMYQGCIMETAPAEALFENPRHPYTLLLLSAIPDPEPGKTHELKDFKGDFSATITPHNGCHFQPRCLLAEPRCRQNKIGFEKVGTEHYVRCWKAAQRNA